MQDSQPIIPDGYKQTDVGIIPEDWEVKKLATTAEIATGNTPPTKDSSNYGDEYLFVSPIDLGEGKYVFDTEKKLSRKGFKISRRFPQGSILFTCIGSTIGKSAIAPTDLTSNQQINALFPNSKYSTDFVFYILNLLAKKIKSSASEQAVPIINKTAFGETLIPLPPLSEQQSIAEILSDVDALITSLDRLIAKKRNIKQGAMQLLLTGKKRLASFSGEWETKKFINAVSKYIDYRGRTPKKLGMEWGDGEIPALSANNVQQGYIDFSKECYLASEKLYKRWMEQGGCEKGDVLLTMEAPLGNVAQIPDDKRYILSQRVILIKPIAQLSKDFLFYLLSHSEFQDQLFINSSGSTAQGIQRKKLDEIEISFPKSFDEQKAIAQILSDIDAEIEALEKRRDKYKAIKQGMMQELLTGKTRLL